MPGDQRAARDRPGAGAGADERGFPHGAILAAAIVLLVVGSIVAVALLRPRSGGQHAAGDTAANAAAGTGLAGDSSTGGDAGSGAGAGSAIVPGTGGRVGASTGASAAAAPTGSAGTSRTEGARDVLRTGTVRMTVVAGQPEDAFDLDTGVKGAPNAFGTGQRPDMAAATLGLNGLNGARFSAWSQPAPPTSATCGAIAAAQWSSSVLIGALVPRAITCVRTSDDRFAALTVQSFDVLGAGQVYNASLAFTVWRKPGD